MLLVFLSSPYIYLLANSINLCIITVDSKKFAWSFYFAKFSFLNYLWFLNLFVLFCFYCGLTSR